MEYIRRRIFRKLNLFLIPALVASAALLVFVLYSDDDYSLPEAAEALEGEPDAEIMPLSRYSVIEEKNIFRLPSREAAEPPPPPVERPRGPEMPSLKLRGTILLASGGGYAVIEDAARREEKTLGIGESISGMELVSVDWNSAGLTGAAGSLDLVISEADAPASAPGRAPAAIPSRRPDSGRSGGVQSFTVPRGRVDDALANVAQMMRDVSVRPVEGGLSVSGIRSGSLADEFGLRDGDVVASVNRRPVNDPENMMRIYSEVMERGRAVVEVIRDGQRVNLIYRIER